MDRVAQAISDFIEYAINVNPVEMLIQVLATLLLFVVIRIYFWGNINDYLERRKDLMNTEINEAQEKNKEATLLQKEADELLVSARVEAKDIIDGAKSKGEDERVKIISKAKADAKKVMENAKDEIASEVEKAKASMNDEIVSVATLMAGKILEKEIDSKKHKKLIEDISKEVAN
jgi:F-type H+-transporting ATPase subunit b